MTGHSKHNGLAAPYTAPASRRPAHGARAVPVPSAEGGRARVECCQWRRAGGRGRDPGGAGSPRTQWRMALSPSGVHLHTVWSMCLGGEQHARPVREHRQAKA